LLLATFLVELFAAVLKSGFEWIYHLFNPIEYSVLCSYYLKACNVSRLKGTVAWSIPVFILFSLFISCFLYHFKSLPALNINVEGCLLFIIFTHLLFSLEVHINIFIYTIPDFWISVGILIFFGGVFVLFGLYSKLHYLDKIRTLELFDIITKPLNIILYSCFITGLIYSIRNENI